MASYVRKELDTTERQNNGFLGCFYTFRKSSDYQKSVRTRFICKKLSAHDPKPSLKGSSVILIQCMCIIKSSEMTLIEDFLCSPEVRIKDDAVV